MGEESPGFFACHAIVSFAACFPHLGQILDSTKYEGISITGGLADSTGQRAPRGNLIRIIPIYFHQSIGGSGLGQNGSDMVVTAEGIPEDLWEDEADRVGPAKDVHGRAGYGLRYLSGIPGWMQGFLHHVQHATNHILH